METDKAFKCFACQLSFDVATELIGHVKYLHNDLDTQSYLCKFKGCIGRSYGNFRSFCKHVLSHKGDFSRESYKKRKVLDSSQPMHTPDLEMLSGDHSDAGKSVDSPSSLDKSLAFFTAVSNAVSRTAANLYSKDTLTRSHVQDIIEEMKNLFCDTYLGILEDSVMQALQKANSPEVGEIRSHFSILRGMFDDVATEHKRLDYFAGLDAYIKPEQYTVGTTNAHKNVQGQIVLQPVSLTGTLISPRKVLKSFLELPNVLDQILSYMRSLNDESDVMENVVQGSLWKEVIKPQFAEKLVMPLNLSFDDVETNKDLGYHTVVHKVSACHLTIACIPPVFQSLLENIFLVLLFHSSDKQFGLEEVFRPLLDELKLLEKEGIELNLNDKTVRVYFALCIISGDNLGLNTILGLVEGFSANYFCRICRTHKEVTRCQVVEDVERLRTPANYDRDLAKNDQVSTGVKKPCIWNELSSFNLTENIYADIMHDVAEGIGNYDMVFIIDNFVKKRYFTYMELNDLVQGFYYGIEFGNKPPLITAENITKNGTVGMSASELLCLIRFFPLMIGHKISDENNPVWKFFLSLRQLVDILFAPTFARSNIPFLNQLVAEHHTQYMELSYADLKPKFHNLVHYGRILQAIGPLKPVWAMRSEAKYKELRQAARVSSCRIKIAYTLSVKASLKLCVRFITKRGLRHRFEFSSYCEQIPVKEMDGFVNFSHKLPTGDGSEMLNVVKWVKVDGTLYKPGMVVVVALDSLYPQFGVIENISVSDSEEASFLVKRLVTIRFNPHLHSYHVHEDPSWDSWEFIKQMNLVTHTPADSRVFFDGHRYVMPRYLL